MLDFETFIATVSRRGGLGREEAVRTTQAVLETLAARLTPGASRDQGAVVGLADHLPLEMAPWLLGSRRGEAFHVDEFLRRVASRTGSDLTDAERHARIVLDVLRSALPREEIADLAADLPHDFQPFVLGLAVPSLSELARHVAERLGVDDGAARRALEAVLETLAERMPPGEDDDLVAALPIEFHEPVRRGARTSDDRFRGMQVGEFLRRVAVREGVEIGVALQHARAVLAALREEITDEAIDISTELSPDYDVLLSR